MSLPVAPVALPADLAGTTNGNLTGLAAVGPLGLLHPLAARAFRALQAAASSAGFHLTYTYGGTYRSYAAQVALFRQRYTQTPLAGRPTKTWNGDTWWQLPNTAMAAVPGTSNHGWALAIDTAIGSDPAHATSIEPQLAWMLAHAPAYGFSWEAQSEPWHIRYVAGDAIPAAVLAYENPPKPEIPPVTPPAPTPGDDMQIGIIECTDAGAQFIGEYVGDGVFLNIRWIHTPEQIAARDAFKTHPTNPAKVFKFAKGQLKFCAVDAVPQGDRVAWAPADFAWVG